jgi:hypothetical protein
MDDVSHLAQLKDSTARKHGFAWIALCLALAMHVIDEALTDFLSVYNPAVQAIRGKLPILPLPTFSFELWLSGLIFAILLLLSLSILVFRGSKWMTPLSYVFAVIMLLNGMMHIAGSFYLGRMMPGVYSSPLLLAGSVYLLVCLQQKGKTL